MAQLPDDLQPPEWPSDSPGRRIGAALGAWAQIDAAKEILIQRQGTHLDSLTAVLRETRVRRVIEPMLAGTTLDDVPQDDIRFAVDLGLCRRDSGGALVIANPIYAAIVPRVLADAAIASLAMVRPTWLSATGRVDIDLYLRYGEDVFGFELKVWRDGEADPQATGLAQLDGYLAGLGLATGWLVIFDQRRGLPPIAERTSAAEAVAPGGRRVVVVRG